MEFSARDIEYRYKSVGLTNMVWLAGLNRYLQMKEPAFRVFQQYTQGVSFSEIVSGCAGRNRIPETEAKRFALDVHQTLSGLFNSHPEKIDPRLEEGTLPGTFDHYSEKYIKIYDKVIRFSFGSRTLEQFIFPLLSQFECQPHPGRYAVHFELFKFGEKVAMRLNGQQESAWPMAEAFKMKGAIFLHIINKLYDADESDWMGVIHASSVSLGRNALMFPAQPGGGKSTLASLLMARGCSLVSDDFTPLSARDRLVYTFPGRISVKPGSLPLLKSYYPELKYTPTDKSGKEGEQLAFLSPRLAENCASSGYSTRAIVFVQYDPYTEFKQERVNNLHAVNDFLRESWLADHADSAVSFLNWYFKVPCIRLSYSNHHKAVDFLLNILQDDA